MGKIRMGERFGLVRKQKHDIASAPARRRGRSR
jgi:hypothetical protein